MSSTNTTSATAFTASEDQGPFPISVIILTFNEEANIRPCIAGLDWADDVILVDSHSTDATIEAARQTRPDVRVSSHAFRDFGDQRNWALDNTDPRHTWVLFLDADERSTPAFADGIKRAVRKPDGKVGFYMSHRNIFLGRWIKRCTLYPSWQLRLLKFGEVRFRKEGHGQKEVTSGPLGYLAEPCDHLIVSKGISEWISRQNAYSTNEVELVERLRSDPLKLSDLLAREPVRRRRCLKRIAARIGFRALLNFTYPYFIRGGFLDGRPGLIYCLLRAAHDIHISAKVAESRAKADGTLESDHSPTPR